MAEKLLKEHLYGDLLSPTPGYYTDFAVGMTYSLSFEALLTAHLAFGMLGEMDDNTIQSPHLLLEAITRSSDKMVVFCNKGGIHVPPTIRKVYSLLERNIYEVFDKRNNKANFHPKLWLIREINNDDKKDILLKLIVTSRNLAYSDNIDCIVCITGKVGPSSIHTEKHTPLVAFIKEVVRESNINSEQAKLVNKLADDLFRVEHFDVDTPFDDYDFFPYLFGKDFGLPDVKDYLVGSESIIVSPFIDKTTIGTLNPNKKASRTLITRKEYVDKDIFDRFCNKGGVYVALDELASRGMDLHAKMYHVWNGRDSQCLYLGSANATTNAFQRNGEFLLGLKYQYGNTRTTAFLKEFYEKDNAESKFLPLNEPLPNASPIIKWDEAESAMKDLMCLEDIKARIIHHHNGKFTIVVSSSTKNFNNDVFIAPMQRKDLLQKWTGRATFDELDADQLSEFYIITATSPEGKQHQAIAKIETTGMPSNREKAIYQGIIKGEKDFYRFLELMLTDTPIGFLTSEILNKEANSSSADDSSKALFPDLYEKMLRIAATNPKQIKEIGKLMEKLGDGIVPVGFMKVYKQFVSALK